MVDAPEESEGNGGEEGNDEDKMMCQSEMQMPPMHRHGGCSVSVE